MTTGRTGRRPGRPDTRAEIIAAARTAFLAKGYADASVRGIAREAGVDPALVHRWFDGKGGLLLAVLQFELDPDIVWNEILQGGPVGLAGRAVSRVTELWESPIGVTAVGAVRENPGLLPAVAGFLAPRIAELIAKALGLSRKEAELRGALLSAHFSGIVMVRYLGQVEPLASLPREDLIRIYTPIAHRILFAPDLTGKSKSSHPVQPGQLS